MKESAEATRMKNRIRSGPTLAPWPLSPLPPPSRPALQVSPGGKFAFVEFAEVVDATCAMCLDGIPFMGTQLHINRPKGYIVPPGVRGGGGGVSGGGGTSGGRGRNAAVRPARVLVRACFLTACCARGRAPAGPYPPSRPLLLPCRRRPTRSRWALRRSRS